MDGRRDQDALPATPRAAGTTHPSRSAWVFRTSVVAVRGWAVTEPLAQIQGDASRGKLVFDQCAACHDLIAYLAEATTPSEGR